MSTFFLTHFLALNIKEINEYISNKPEVFLLTEIWRKYKPYIISVLIALAVGGLSALVTRGSMDIYKDLNQPPLSPPGSVFPIVWGILFTLMGIGSACVWVRGQENGIDTKKPLTLYAVNLLVNFLWSVIFFNLRFYLLAVVWLILLIAIIIAMIISFKIVCPWGAYIQIPYLIWCLFALYLTIGIYVLN